MPPVDDELDPPLELDELELELDDELLLEPLLVLLVPVLPPKLDELPEAPLLVEDEPDELPLDEEEELPELLPLDPEEPLEPDEPLEPLDPDDPLEPDDPLDPWPPLEPCPPLEL